MKDRIVKQYDNGLKLVYKRNISKEAIFLDICFGSGLLNDPKDKLGLAHFVEHCLTLSNNKYTNNEKKDFLIKLYYANMATNASAIRLYAYVSDEEFEDVLAFYVNNLTDFNITDEEFERERKVIEQEILRYRKTLNDESRYTRCENLFDDDLVRVRTFGTIETLNNITKQDIEDYIKECFVLSNMQISVYGNIGYLKLKRLIKKYVLKAFPEKVNKKYLKNFDTIVYKDHRKVMAVNPSPDGIKSRVEIIHRIHLSDKDRFRAYAVSILRNIFESVAIHYFRNQFGLCYASQLSFNRYVSADKSHDILEMCLYVDCEEKLVKEVLDKLPEFYSYIESYKIDKESVEKAKTTYRRYDKVYPTANFIKRGESMAAAEFEKYIYYSYRENQKYKKKKEKISVDFVKDVFKKVALEKPFVFVVSNTTDELPKYADLCKSIKKNSKWMAKI